MVSISLVLARESTVLELNPKYLEFEGKAAFVVLSYPEFLRIQEQLMQLDDTQPSRPANDQETDAPAVLLAEARERYDPEISVRQAHSETEPLALDSDLAGSLEATAHQMHRSVNELVNEAVKQYLSARWREQLEQEIAAYAAMHSELWRTVPGVWVAVHNRTVVDRDSDKAALYRRVHNRFGKVPVLIRRVKAEPTEEIWVRTPSTGRLNP